MKTATYQGCAVSLDVSAGMKALAETLAGYEGEPQWVAEPKFDGIWAEATFKGRVSFVSRNGKAKRVEYLESIRDKRFGDTVVVGELAYGSQESLKRREEKGHEFMDVFDILRWNGKDIRDWRDSDRRKALFEWWGGLSSKAREAFCPAQRWTKDFLAHFKDQHEGIILKDTNHPYVGGKVYWWIKVKKWKSDDMILMDMRRSAAKTKGPSMARAVLCGQYADGELKPLTWVGGMPHEWSAKFGRNFSAYKGKVVVVNHFGRFKSGAVRHPSLDVFENGSVIRTDKPAKECIWDGEHD